MVCCTDAESSEMVGPVGVDPGVVFGVWDGELGSVLHAIEARQAARMTMASRIRLMKIG